MSDPVRPLMTVEEFLVWDDGTDTRYELVGGRPVAMAPPALAHSALALAIGARLLNRLRPPCRPFSEVGVQIANRGDSFFQADLAVTCRPWEPGTSMIPDPSIIVEVLSPSTEGHDRGVKLPAYREIPSVQEILLISSTRRHAELWRRLDGKWLVQDFVGDGILVFESVGIELPMSVLYDGIL